MATYASTTQVSPEKTRSEIERLVTGARTGSDARASRTEPPRRRTSAEQQRAYEQAIRTSWRALFLVIKAKLEAVEAGIGVFESEFLAHIIVPGTNQTFGEWAIPQIAAAYERGASLPPMLPGGPT